MFLHYPATNILEETSCFTEIAEEYGAEAVVYSHCHGESRFHDSIYVETVALLALWLLITQRRITSFSGLNQR